ncbi:MAG: type II toxin-antitoxin system HigB family toxin [Candidatus Poribacteria bacterium]|nr:type II toxin-antitoxin system HigB family toxin [Candidatus Poribacteria bacterium]
MHIITRKRLNEFVEQKDKTAKPALERWYRLMKKCNFQSPIELLQTFSRENVDQVNNLTVFDIGGKSAARLIAAIHYDRKKVYIRAVLTHAEYDKGNWKE